MVKAPPAPFEKLRLPPSRKAPQVIRIGPPLNPPKAIATFYHSGDLGDIIFSLPTVRALGGGVMILGPHCGKPPFITRENMTPHRASMLIPLLKEQPYIRDCYFAPVQPNVSYDLNQFRKTLEKAGPHDNLAYLHCRHFGVSETECEKQWLSVNRPIRIEGKPVIVTKTLRYAGELDWVRIVNHYRGLIAFVGLEDEWKAFTEKFGDVYYHPTRNLLEAARVIAGADLFIGNQSGVHAVAEGLKATMIHEPCPSCHVAMFDRPNVWFHAPERLPLGLKPKMSIEFKACLDGFSGIGQSGAKLILGLRDRGHDISVTPTRQIPSPFGVPDPQVQALKKPPAPGSQAIIYETTGPFMRVNFKPGDVALTLWESDKWPDEEVASLNRARLVLVTCKWNAESLAKSGCTRPIKTVPLGVDAKVFHPGGKRSEILTIGAAARVAGAGGRKGIDTAIEAFKAAFRWQQDVRLRIKVFSDCPVEDPKDSRIEINREFLPENDLAEWHRQNHSFLSPSMGEGWGLCLHQAMACGATPIACCFGGYAEFFDSQVGYEIPFHLAPHNKPGVFAGMGKMAHPNFWAIVMTLRRIYANRRENEMLGNMAVARAHSFNWERAVDVLEDRLLCTLSS